MKSIRQYVRNRGITVDILAGPDFQTDKNGWEHHRYDIQLNNEALGTSMILCGWKDGIGITAGPDEKPEIVLDHLVGESWGYESAGSFENWATEYDLDTDSRRVERTWRAVGEHTRDFLNFIGGGAELEKLALTYERL